MANRFNFIQDLDQTDLYSSYRSNSIQECVNYIGDQNLHLTIICQNIRSIQKNFDNFVVFLSRLQFQPDLVILTECRLNDSTPLFSLQNYQIHYSTNYINQNDGIAILYKSELSIVIDEPPFVDANCVLIHIGKEFTICALYRSPSVYNIHNFCDSLEKVLQYHNNSNRVIVGDINIDIKIGTADKRTDQYLDLLSYYGYCPGHQLPTHDRNCLDHVMLNTKRDARTAICDSGITDHDTVMIGVSKNTPTAPPPSSDHVIKIDFPNLTKTIAEIDWSFIYEYQDTTEAVTRFSNTMSNKICAFSTTVQVRNSKAIRKPWITSGLLKCMLKRDKLHTEAKKEHNKENVIVQQKYKNYRNTCNNLIQNLKDAHEKKELDDASGNNKKIWTAVKKICNIKTKNAKCMDLLQIHSDPKQSLNHVNHFFSNIGEQLAQLTMSRINKTETELAAMIDSHSSGNLSGASFFVTPTDQVEVTKIISNLKENSAGGWDGITNKILKLSKQHLAAPIAFLCNLSISTGTVPAAMKIANICPIFKSGDKTIASNYRPISLLTSLSKILEKVMNIRLLKFLEKNALISENQYGFRNNRSTEDAVTDLTDFVVTKIDEGYKCTGVFLDLAKAFDTISRNILLKRMEELGIRGTPLKWFESYLTGRTQRVCINNTYSDSATVKYGVPQGSVLGPTLFIIYINKLCSTVLAKAKIYAYADDTALIFYDKTWNGVYEAVESGINLVSKWLNHNLLTLNVEKTKVLNFSVNTKTKCPNQLTVKLHSCANSPVTGCTCPGLERVDNIKYLGVYIDKHLTWCKQIDYVSSRVRKLIYIFKKMGRIANEKTLKMIYHSLCVSVISYCITTWGTAHKTHLIKLERAQRAILKVTYKKPIRYSTDDLYRETGLLRVRQLYIMAVSLRFHKHAPSLISISKRPHRNPKWDKPHCRLHFGNRCFLFMGPYIYAKLNNNFKILSLTRLKCKKLIHKFLSDMDYNKTENFLRVF